MKKLSRINRKSFFYVLIKNYLLFTLANVMIIYIMLCICSLVTAKFLDFPYGYPSQQISILESGAYNDLNIKELVGKNGYIEILDEDNNVIYTSEDLQSKKPLSSYTDEELKYIPEYGNERVNINVKRYKENDNEFILITNEEYVYKGNDEYKSNDVWFQILDNNLNVVYSGGKLDSEKVSYTKKEFEYLTGNISEKYNVSKYSFYDDEGKDYTLILKGSKLSEDRISTIVDRVLMLTFILFIIIYTICTVLFVIWLNRKIKKPLKKLNNAMISLADGNDNEIIEYKGPSEFMQICNDFNIMADKLSESKKYNELLETEKQKMIADISHDLKTPITIIQGYAKALTDGIISKDEEEKYLKIIYQKSNNITELIDVFHEYSKLEHTDFTLNLKEKDISEFVRAYVAEKYEYIYDIGLFMDVDIPEKECICKIDEVQLKRAFENIISNSIKHNEEGITLYIYFIEKKDYCKIIIGDNGIGIPKEIKENVFDAFVVGDDSRNTKQGSGLGLAITKKIIEKHSGSIKLLSSKRDLSTAFEIKLPKNK